MPPKIINNEQQLVSQFIRWSAQLGSSSNHQGFDEADICCPRGHWDNDPMHWVREALKIPALHTFRQADWVKQGMAKSDIAKLPEPERVVAAAMEYTGAEYMQAKRSFFRSWVAYLKQDGTTCRSDAQWQKWCENGLVRHHQPSKAQRWLDLMNAVGLLDRGRWANIYAGLHPVNNQATSTQSTAFNTTALQTLYFENTNNFGSEDSFTISSNNSNPDIGNPPYYIMPDNNTVNDSGAAPNHNAMSDQSDVPMTDNNTVDGFQNNNGSSARDAQPAGNAFITEANYDIRVMAGLIPGNSTTSGGAIPLDPRLMGDNTAQKNNHGANHTSDNRGYTLGGATPLDLSVMINSDPHDNYFTNPQRVPTLHNTRRPTPRPAPSNAAANTRRPTLSTASTAAPIDSNNSNGNNSPPWNPDDDMAEWMKEQDRITGFKPLDVTALPPHPMLNFFLSPEAQERQRQERHRRRREQERRNGN